MRTIDASLIRDTVARLCVEANCNLPQDVKAALEAARAQEPWPLAKGTLELLEKNLVAAKAQDMPICQDTGMACVFVELGTDVHIEGDFEAAIHEGVRMGYGEGYLRKSIVGDPLRRVNTGDNTPAILHLELVGGDEMTITVAPKGFGSENMTSLHMLKPSVTQEMIEDTIVHAVSTAGSNPCPPVVVGVGLGGDAEQCAILAKKALLRPVNERNSDPFYAEMELRLLKKINALGIGPQGLGGTTTALSVAINVFPTHIAGLPCCVNLGCHVTRHASCVL